MNVFDRTERASEIGRLGRRSLEVGIKHLWINRPKTLASEDCCG